MFSPQVMNLQRLEGKKGLGKALILESVLVAEVLSYIFLPGSDIDEERFMRKSRN